MTFAYIPRFETTDIDEETIREVGVTSIYDLILCVSSCVNTGDVEEYYEWIYDNYQYITHPHDEATWCNHLAHLENLYQRVSHYLKLNLGVTWHTQVTIEQIDLVLNGYVLRMAEIDQ